MDSVKTSSRYHIGFIILTILVVLTLYYNVTTSKTISKTFQSIFPFEFNTKELTTKTTEIAFCEYLTFQSQNGMRLGNNMFLYASFLGIAKENKKLPFIRETQFPLRQMYKLTVNESSTLFNNNFTTINELGAYIFNDSIIRLDCKRNYSVYGYRMCYKYFDKYAEDIRKEFTFVDNIERTCIKVVAQLVGNYCSEATQAGNCTLIGAHMRRGDFTWPDKQGFGHVPATSEYLRKAVDFFENRFFNHSTVFVILGDDFQWNLNNAPNISNLIVLKPTSPELDMCILSKCNHTIISSGSYGWWAAYLAGGEATYMANQCRPTSSLCREYNAHDYIKNTWKWTPLS